MNEGKKSSERCLRKTIRFQKTSKSNETKTNQYNSFF